MNKLYTLKQTNQKTGKIKTLYFHATENVMSESWAAYVDESHSVTIEEYQGPRLELVANDD